MKTVIDFRSIVSCPPQQQKRRPFTVSQEKCTWSNLHWRKKLQHNRTQNVHFTKRSTCTKEFWNIPISAEPCWWSYLATFDPVKSSSVSEGQSEGAKVGDHTGRDEHVSHQSVVDALKVVGSLGPTILLPTQTSDQLLGSHQLLSAQVHLQRRRKEMQSSAISGCRHPLEGRPLVNTG